MRNHSSDTKHTSHSCYTVPSQLLQQEVARQHRQTAKRQANRRSAAESRARKKALVESLQTSNAALERQVSILHSLPDLVVVIQPNGTIVFASQRLHQALERAHETSLWNIVAPSSRGTLTSYLRQEQMPMVEAPAENTTNNNSSDESDDTASSTSSSSQPKVVTEEEESGDDDLQQQQQHRPRPRHNNNRIGLLHANGSVVWTQVQASALPVTGEYPTAEIVLSFRLKGKA